MSKKNVKCDTCGRLMNQGKFIQHLQFPKNHACLLDFRKRLKELSPTSSDLSTPTQPSKRQKTDSASTTTESDFSSAGNVRRGLDFGTPEQEQAQNTNNNDLVDDLDDPPAHFGEDDDISAS